VQTGSLGATVDISDDGFSGLNVWMLKVIGSCVYMQTSVSVASHGAALVNLLKQGKGTKGWL
jgi:hypothetical protein